MRVFSMILVSVFLCSACELFEEEETGTPALEEPELWELGLTSCYDACRGILETMVWEEAICTDELAGSGCNPNTYTTCHIKLSKEVCDPLCDGVGDDLLFAANEEDVDKCFEYLDSANCDEEAYESPWSNENCRSVFIDIDLPLEKPY